MGSELKNNLPYGRTVFALGIFSLLFGVLVAFVGMLFAPIYTGVLASFWLYEKKSKGILAPAVAITVIIISVLIGNVIPAIEVFSAISALLIAFAFSKNISKGECAGYLTALFALMLIVSFIGLACLQMNDFSLDAIKSYSESIYNDFCAGLLKQLEDMKANLPIESQSALPNEESVLLLIDGVINALPSMAVIFAFLLAGVSLKVFGAVASRMNDVPLRVFEWRFATSSVFAWFYVVLIFLSMIAGAADVFGITVINVYNVFMIVYAYIGFNFVRTMLAMRRSSGFATLALIAVILIASGFAVTLLSYIGVYFTIARNKALKNANGEGNDLK